MTFVFYSILGIGVILKLRYGSPAPADLFATHVRDYGFLLLLLPAASCGWSLYELQKPASDHRILNADNFAYVVAALLFMIAVLATTSAISYNSLFHL